MARSLSLVDGSLIITEALVKSGADIFIGYPITPSNRFYAYGKQRFPQFFAAPDEISVLQWMAGASAAGKLPVTATAFPGLALMVESINMAYAMELPMVIVVTQRLGPSTGSATTGAQGDLALINGLVPGYPIPTFCPANFTDCWNLANKAVETALHLRTPVIFLTSKEMVMTSRSFNLNELPDLPNHRRSRHSDEDFRPFDLTELEPMSKKNLGSDEQQVRFNASTHNKEGRIIKNDESLSLTSNLRKKILRNAAELFEYEYWPGRQAKRLIVSHGVSALAAMDAWLELKNNGQQVSLLILKTLIPLTDQIVSLIGQYEQVIIVEENINGQLKELIFGQATPQNVRSLNKLGKMIKPSEIVHAIS